MPAARPLTLLLTTFKSTHIYRMDVHEEEQVGEPEKRKAKDGKLYTTEEFLAFFGDLRAWEAVGIKTKARRGAKHKRSQEAMVDRIHRRLTIEYERAIRTCKCPPWEPHREGCGMSTASSSPSYINVATVVPQLPLQAAAPSPPASRRQAPS